MKNTVHLFFTVVLFAFLCQESPQQSISKADSPENTATFSIIVLGTVQDAGSPHIACDKDCCKDLFGNPDSKRKVVSLGLFDAANKRTFLFEATPDIAGQLKTLKNRASWNASEIPNGIFITHAHIGHYTGLMYLGKEATNAKKIPVHVMSKMKNYLETNGPWNQLVANQNITLIELNEFEEIVLSPQLKVIPFRVPHRDEYSETVGYTIVGPNKKLLFIPDIDKWGKWEANIVDEIAKVDYALLDGTFFDGEEINHRDISEIPHPFVIESMELFKDLPATEKGKISFIHLNHTNPLLNSNSKGYQRVLENGFKIAKINERIDL